MFKKISRIMLVGCLLANTGCIKKKDVNGNRETDKKFDIIDYIDINVFGEDGDGYIEITKKDISAKDFESDEDYIQVKKDLDDMNLYYITGGTSSSSISANKTKGISNGDTVKLSFKTSTTDEDLCTSAYSFTVEGLADKLETIDLFDENLFGVYQIDESNFGNYVHADALEDQTLQKNLEYTTSSNDSTVELDKTVIQCTAALNSNYTNQNQYVDLKEYLAKQGKKAELEKSFVVKNSSETINWSIVDAEQLKNTISVALYQKMAEGAKYDVVMVKENNTTSTETANQYNYCVCYRIYDNATGTYNYYKIGAWLGMVNDKYVCNISDTSGNSTSEEGMHSDDQLNPILISF